MRVYVASRFSSAGKLATRVLHTVLKRRGHTITRDWTWADGGGVSREETAKRNMDGVWTADALLIVPMEGSRDAWVEFGIALARLIPIVVLEPSGRERTVSESLPRVVHVKTIDEAMEALECFRF